MSTGKKYVRIFLYVIAIGLILFVSSSPLFMKFNDAFPDVYIGFMKGVQLMSFLLIGVSLLLTLIFTGRNHEKAHKPTN